jgi:CHAT domain-containing protein
VHLVSAFQLAGFPHVIGTLWEINDRIAVQITQKFYRALSAGGAVLDTTAAAHALHRAVLHVRDKYPEVPSIWAAHIHTGA